MKRSSATRLGWAALLLLTLAALVLAAATYEQLRGMRADSDRTRSQLMAQSMGQRIAHAVESGVPLRSLVGVEALFQQRMTTQPDIQSITLSPPEGQALWSVRREGAGPPGATATAPVLAHGQPIATVTLVLRADRVVPFASATAARLLPAIALLALLAYLAARFSQANGPQLRNHAATLARRAISRGQYLNVVVLPARRGFDLRVQQLGHAVRGVHETLVRVRRLIASLRQTEPQPARREVLDQLLSAAQGPDHFTDQGLGQVRVVAAQAQAFWIALLTTLGAVALQTLWWRTGLAQGEALQAWHGMDQALPAAALAFGLALLFAWSLVQARRWPAPGVVLLACAALGVSAAACAGGGADAPTWATALVPAVLHGGAVGAVLAACQGIERVPLLHQDYLHAAPRWPAATWGGWLGAAVWLGPALGSLADAALGPVAGAWSLLLPAVCAAFFVVRWNAPRSPWRIRTAPPGAHGTRSLLPGMLAAGLLAGSAWSAHAHGQAALWAPLLGLGAVAGLLRRGSRSLRPLACSALLCCALALAVPHDALPAQAPAALLMLAGLALGLVAGRCGRTVGTRLTRSGWAGLGLGLVAATAAGAGGMAAAWPLGVAAVLLCMPAVPAAEEQHAP